jgi:hydrogenase-4 component E
LYSLQSSAIVLLLLVSVFDAHSIKLLLITVLTLVVKVILAPIFFTRLVKRHELKFTANTYANVPETLAVIVAILILASSHIFDPLTNLVPAHHPHLVLALAAMLTSIFLMVNRKGALSQVVGVLSLENTIVAFAILAGLEQSAALQAGVIFDIAVWLIVAVTMLLLVYRHHGSLDVTKMKKLRDE